MPRARSQSFVIDASVARAAGPENAAHPRAKCCRDFLLAILQICHRAVFSEALSAEWKRHQSSFARQWLVSMFARKKIDRLDVAEEPVLRERLDKSCATESQALAVRKDTHLIEAALAQGMRIAALDDRVRDYLRAVAATVTHVRKISWVNPEKPDEGVLDWLHRGARLENSRTLGHGIPEK